MIEQKDIIKTETSLVGDIKHTTHYVNRPMRAGDQLGGAIGETINGVEKTTEIIRYVFDIKKEISAVEWLAEKYNYVNWMRNRDEISAGTADEWRRKYLEQAKQMEEQQNNRTN